MYMLAKDRMPGRFDLELSAQPLEELVKSVFNCFPGLRSDTLLGRDFGSRMEIEVTDDAVEVKFPCPGRCKEDISLEIVNDFLTVKASACCHREEGKEKKNYVIRERRCETVEESVKLPVPVKGTEAKARYEHGVLEITLPRLVQENEKHHVVKIN